MTVLFVCIHSLCRLCNQPTLYRDAKLCRELRQKTKRDAICVRHKGGKNRLMVDIFTGVRIRHVDCFVASQLPGTSAFDSADLLATKRATLSPRSSSAGMSIPRKRRRPKGRGRPYKALAASAADRPECRRRRGCVAAARRSGPSGRPVGTATGRCRPTSAPARQCRTESCSGRRAESYRMIPRDATGVG